MNKNKLSQWLNEDATEADYSADAEVLLKELSSQQTVVSQAVAKGLARVTQRAAHSLYDLYKVHPYRSLALAGTLGIFAGLLISTLRKD